ncbi:MAG: hypothetical protein QHH04_07995 [Methanolinea sp.]|nr:hypothetical protein [Methanolinea sp.]
MKGKTRIFLTAVIVLIAVVGCIASGARTLPPANETSQITVVTSASAIGTLRANTEIVYVQGNDNLTDNPPLQDNGEGQSTISYTEDTLAVNGAVMYDKYMNLDTGPKTQNSDNLETQRQITYDSSGDGNSTGKMISSESILVEAVATGETTGDGCCPWGTGEGTELGATNDLVIAGSNMVVSEAAVTSESGARITADAISTPVGLDYGIQIEGLNQTVGDPSTGAVGTATAYVSANLQEGLGNSTAVGTSVTYSDVTSASGLFTLAKEVSYTSG